MASLYRGGKRAGASKRTLTQRQKDNIRVKDGTIRRGAGGKRLNVYDAKTGTWKRAVKTSAVKKRSAAAATRPSVKKATTATERRRDAAMASRRTSTASTRSTSTNRVSAAQASRKKTGSYQAGSGTTARPRTGSTLGGSGSIYIDAQKKGAAQYEAKKKREEAAARAAAKASSNKPKTGGSTSWAGEIGKTFGGVGSAVSRATAGARNQMKQGAERTVKRNGKTVTEVYKGNKWVVKR
jgi:hypothetical protein